MFDFELIDVIGAVVLILLVSSVAIVVIATPEVAETPRPPDANWSIEGGDGGRLVISHEGGEPVDKDNLTIIVDEYPRPVEWSGSGNGSDDGFVREGDSATIRVTEGQTITLYWTGVDTVRRVPLAEATT